MGECVARNNEPVCECPHGFTGTNCEHGTHFFIFNLLSEGFFCEYFAHELHSVQPTGCFPTLFRGKRVINWQVTLCAIILRQTLSLANL